MFLREGGSFMTFFDRVPWWTLAMVAAGTALAGGLFLALSGARAVSGPSIERAGTIILTDAPGGDAARAQLFKVGDVAISGSCSANQDGSVREFLLVRNGTNHVVMLAVEEFGSEVLPAGDTEALTADEPATRSAQQRSFAILDERGVSASGVGAVSVNPAARRCVFTAQVAG
jgi:hypothetical protein